MILQDTIIKGVLNIHNANPTISASVNGALKDLTINCSNMNITDKDPDAKKINVNIYGNSTVTGNTTTGSMKVNEATTTGSMEVSGATTTGSMVVSGATTTNGNLNINSNLYLKNNVSYGSTVPSTGIEGQIFFKIV